MTTVERLQGYYPDFSQETLEAVGEFTDWQRQFGSYQAFFDSVGVKEPVVKHYEGMKPAAVVDVQPSEYDPAEALLYRLPMANPLDGNQLYQIASLAGTNPNKRIIAIGNPSGPGLGRGKLSFADQRKALKWTKNDNIHPELKKLVEPSIKYLDEAGVEERHEVGYSYGALLAVIASVYGESPVRNMVVIEPVMGERTMRELGADFKATEKALGNYINANELQTFKEARADGQSMVRYILGLLRPTNITVSNILAHTNFDTWNMAAHLVNPEMRSTPAWGSESELALDGLMLQMVGRIQRTRREGSTRPIRIEGGKHALANDLALQEAIVLEGLAA